MTISIMSIKYTTPRCLKHGVVYLYMLNMLALGYFLSGCLLH